MVDHDNEVSYEAEDNYDDDNGADSLLNEALASGQAVQIFRKPREGQQSRMSIMGFFGGDDVPEEDVVTAQPASLFTMRQVARENLKNAQNKKKNGNSPRGRRPPQRSVTFGAEGNETASRRRNQMAASLQPSRSFSPTTPSGRRPLSRSLTTNPHRESNEPQDATVKSSQAYSTHEETIKRLTVQDDEIQQILQDPKAFGRLQKVLRKHGAVTNEVLKQVLPLYVKHQMNSQAAKEAERKKAEDESKVRDRQAVVGAIQQHSARNLLIE